MDSLPPSEALEEFFSFTKRYPQHDSPALYLRALKAVETLNTRADRMEVFEQMMKFRGMKANFNVASLSEKTQV